MKRRESSISAAAKRDSLPVVQARFRALVPLDTLARWEAAPAPLSVSHEGQFAALTFPFNLADDAAFSDATRAINETLQDLGIPEDIQRQFSGTAGAYRDSLESQPLLIAAALLVIYLLLGVLYESFLHPLTILSTLPSAGLGALLALQAAGLDFSLMALIGVFLLIGIVKRNAIMMIDFALEAERQRGRSPAAAIHEACLLRLRPILMISLAALLGALPLMLGTGATTAKATWGQPAEWCEYSGTINGTQAGIKIIPDPTNFRPSWWHNRDYGVFVANPFGRKAMKQGEQSRVEVKRGETFRLKFTVVLHTGKKSSGPAAGMP